VAAVVAWFHSARSSAFPGYQRGLVTDSPTLWYAAPMTTRSNSCPAGCSGGHSHRQHRIEATLLATAGLTDAWTKNAMQCGYCDMVYSIDAGGEKIRRGFFGGNTLVTPENWNPIER
jgi:hypothetical protein